MKTYAAEGLVQGCFIIDSLLLSTLECFFRGSLCFSTMITYVNESIDTPLHAIQWMNTRPLNRNNSLSRFSPITKLSEIVEQMFIEEWNKSFSFDLYYSKCSPQSCSYSVQKRQNNFLQVLVSLISALAGLALLLRLIIPPTVQFIFRFLQPRIDQPRQGN